MQQDLTLLIADPPGLVQIVVIAKQNTVACISHADEEVVPLPFVFQVVNTHTRKQFKMV